MNDDVHFPAGWGFPQGTAAVRASWSRRLSRYRSSPRFMHLVAEAHLLAFSRVPRSMLIRELSESCRLPAKVCSLVLHIARVAPQALD